MVTKVIQIYYYYTVLLWKGIHLILVIINYFIIRIITINLSSLFSFLVDISVGLSKNDPLYVSKRAYLAKSGRDAVSVRFPLQQNRYPSELVDFLRLLLVEPDDIGMQVYIYIYIYIY